MVVSLFISSRLPALQMNSLKRMISVKAGKFYLLRVTLLIVVIVVLVAFVFQPRSTASAAAILTITPLTWNTIGLDSNDVV
jgi:hypothetical protein